MMQRFTKKITMKHKICCNLTPIVDVNPSFIQHTWYLPSNGPKIATTKKMAKIAKNPQKLPKKKGDFVQQNLTQRRGDVLWIFFESISLACLRGAIWTPKFLSATLFSQRYVWNNIAKLSFNLNFNLVESWD